MDKRNGIVMMVLLALSVFAIAGTVSYLSNSVNANVTTQSPVVLSVSAVDADGNPVDPTSVSMYGGETITLVLTAENKANVSTSGTYALSVSPTLTTTDVSVDGTNVTSGDITTVNVKSTTIPAKSTETINVTVTVPSNVTPQAYSFTAVYNN